MKEEKRIYVIVAHTVDSNYMKNIPQPLGRQCAQAVHATRKMQASLPTTSKAMSIRPITTIILSVRNSKEMYLIQKLLTDAGVDHAYFHDTNEEAYFGRDKVLTALATDPVLPKAITGILDHLPLWPVSSLLK